MRFSFKPRHVAMVGLFFGAIILAACSSDIDHNNVPARLVNTLPPRIVATVLPGCATGDLSDWYEMGSTLILTFRDESQTALDRTPDQMAPVLERLIDLRTTVADRPVPECGLDAHAAIVSTMQMMLNAMQRYASGELTQEALRDQIAAGSARIETDLTPRLDALQATLEEQIQRERNAPAVTANPPPADPN